MNKIAAFAVTLLALSCGAQGSGSMLPTISIMSKDRAPDDNLQLQISRSIMALTSNGKSPHSIRSPDIAIIESIDWAFLQNTGALVTVQQQSESNGQNSDVCWLYQVEGNNLIALQSFPYCQWKPPAKLETRNGSSWLRISMSIRQTAESPIEEDYTVVLFSTKTKAPCLLYKLSPRGFNLCSHDEIDRSY